jgi:topoisomerase-4 subunit A
MSDIENIDKVDFTDEIGKRYLSYALSTIMSRSLPDLRDGLKPVHRRLIFAMHQLKLDPKSGYKKCARIVGDVIGKFHPHGDVAVYDALVRLAQDFSLRYPLIDGQGNFGSIDGDNAAAMRYTESRLTSTALMLIDDLSNNVVDFKPNYDGSDTEPDILPASFPNLLANGAEGIAVGMASSIPPHNILELCDAMLQLSNNPNISDEELVDIIKGPDFPTGGIVVESKQSIINTYKTGKGSFRIRALWEKEILSHGLFQVVITELPYQVNKSKLIEKIAELLKNKKLPLLDNIRDESDENIRIILEPKNRTTDPEILMESLFKLTDLESRYNVNLNVLSNGIKPQVMSIKNILLEFLSFRRDMITKRSKYQLNNIQNRLEVLLGLHIAYLNIDKIIDIIRNSDDPKKELTLEFSLSERQVEAILNMRLRTLHKLEELAILKEKDELTKNAKKLENILSSSTLLEKTLCSEITNVINNFSKEPNLSRRRTTITHDFEEKNTIDIEAFIEKEPITILLSEKGWIKAVKGHAQDLNDSSFKDGDKISFSLECFTTDKIILPTNSGKFFTIQADKISKGKGGGEPIRIIIDLESDDIVLDLFIYKEDGKLLIASTNSKAFIVEMKNVIAQTKNGKQIVDVTKPTEVMKIIKINNDDNLVAVIGENRKLLIFSIEQIPIAKRGQGVLLQKYKDGSISDVTIFNSEKGLKYGSRYNLTDYTGYMSNRASAGRISPLGMPRNNKFIVT